MKTTIDIAEPLLTEAKLRAKAEGTTLRSLIERGLQAVLSKPRTSEVEPLSPVTVELTPVPGVDPDNWEQIRDMIYEPRHPW